MRPLFVLRKSNGRNAITVCCWYARCRIQLEFHTVCFCVDEWGSADEGLCSIDHLHRFFSFPLWLSVNVLLCEWNKTGLDDGKRFRRLHSVYDDESDLYHHWLCDCYWLWWLLLHTLTSFYPYEFSTTRFFEKGVDLIQSDFSDE